MRRHEEQTSRQNRRLPRDGGSLAARARQALSCDGNDARVRVPGSEKPIVSDLYIGGRDKGSGGFKGLIDELKRWMVAHAGADLCRCRWRVDDAVQPVEGV